MTRWNVGGRVTSIFILWNVLRAKCLTIFLRFFLLKIKSHYLSTAVCRVNRQRRSTLLPVVYSLAFVCVRNGERWTFDRKDSLATSNLTRISAHDSAPSPPPLWRGHVRRTRVLVSSGSIKLKCKTLSLACDALTRPNILSDTRSETRAGRTRRGSRSPVASYIRLNPSLSPHVLTPG